MQELLDFDDLESPKQRRERLLLEAEERRQAEARQLAETRARVDAARDRHNARALVREYRRFGVEPPFTNGHGIPTTSLSLLLSNGWRVEEVGGKNVLLRP